MLLSMLTAVDTIDDLLMQRGNGVMDGALACCTCAGGPGSIPAVGVAKQGAFHMVFLLA